MASVSAITIHLLVTLLSHHTCAIIDITGKQYKVVDEGISRLTGASIWSSLCNSAACQTFDLSENNFTSTRLSKLDFRDTPNDELENRVKYLNLSHNHIMDVALEVFAPGVQADSSWTLITLDLSYNLIIDLSTFPSTLTRGSLERVFLQNNQISQLGDVNVFRLATWDGFLELNLEFNQLIEMPGLGFGNPYSELATNAIINVKNNNISNIDVSSCFQTDGSYCGLYFLITVDFENNSFTEWTFDMIDQNWDTEVYILNNNKITHLAQWSPSDQASYYNLRELYINNNEVITIDTQAFDNFNKLEILEMENNRITSFPFDSLFDVGKLPAFAQLDLENNAITAVGDESSTFPRSYLVTINVQGNNNFISFQARFSGTVRW